MIARVNTSLLNARVRMALHRHRLLGVICINILENLILAQWGSILRITCKPKSRRLCIKIISDTQVVFPRAYHLDSAASLRLLLLSHWLSKHVIVVEVVDIGHLVVLLASSRSVHDLDLGSLIITFIIEVKYLLLFNVTLFLWVLGLDPAILKVHLQVISILLVELLELFDSLLAWDSLSHQVLLVLWQVLVDEAIFAGFPPDQKV